MLLSFVNFVLSRLELVVDPWLGGLWKAIKESLSKMASVGTAHLKESPEDSTKETPDSSVPDVQLNLLSIADQQNCESVRASVPADSKFASVASSSVSAASDLKPASPAGSPGLASQSGDAASVSTSASKTHTEETGVPHVALAHSLSCSVPPLSESSLNVPALPPTYLDVSLQEVDTMEEVMDVLAARTWI